jgi:hypothetical protein
MEKFLRDWRQDAFNKAQYESAIFIGDKLLALTSGFTLETARSEGRESDRKDADQAVLAQMMTEMPSSLHKFTLQAATTVERRRYSRSRTSLPEIRRVGICLATV